VSAVVAVGVVSIFKWQVFVTAILTIPLDVETSLAVATDVFVKLINWLEYVVLSISCIMFSKCSFL
jgi:hypothetical protein